MTCEFVGIDHVQLAAPAGCKDAARDFYHGALGMCEIPKPDKLKARGGVWFQCGAHQVHIGVQQDFAPARKAHPAFEVRGLAALRTRLESRGVKVQDDDALEGAERIYIDDPFGNRIELLEWRR